MEYDFSNLDLFDGLTDAETKIIFSELDKPQHYSKGDFLITHSNFQNSLGILLQGEAKINVPSESNTRVVLKRLHSGDIFGAAALFDAKQYVTDILATAPCDVLFIGKEKLLSIFEQYPPVSINYIKMLTERVKFLNERIKSLSAKDAHSKLCEYLYNNARDDNSIPMPKSINELAKNLGIGRSSLYRALEQLENNGTIKRRGKEIFLL